MNHTKFKPQVFTKKSFLNKEKIVNSFSKSAKTYEKWAIPQNQVAQYLALRSNKSTSKGKILDAGCGTGFLTKHLLDINPSLDIYGLDISHDMLVNYSNVNSKIMLGDMESLPFDDESFYHTLSSFSLHWTDLEKSLPELVRVTTHYLSFALPIKGTLPDFNFPFPERDFILDILQKNKIQIKHSKTYQEKIGFSGLELLKYFHFTGTMYNQAGRVGLFSKSWLESWVQQYQHKEFFYIILYVTGCK